MSEEIDSALVLNCLKNWHVNA